MAQGGISLEEIFSLFAKFGDSKSDGKVITLTNVDKWLKQANVVDGKKLTTTDTGIAFNKLKSKTITYKQFMEFIEDLANSKKMSVDEIKTKLLASSIPGAHGVTQVLNVGGVDRLTDTSLYTGSHKERFDESGKGKGKEGREDVTDGKGYVSGYKNADTYDKTHK